MAQNLNFFFSDNSSERICNTLDDTRFNLSSVMTLMSLCYGLHPLVMSVPVEKLI